MKESHAFVAKAIAIWAFLSLPGNFATLYFLYWEPSEADLVLAVNQTVESTLVTTTAAEIELPRNPVVPRNANFLGKNSTETEESEPQKVLVQEIVTSGGEGKNFLIDFHILSNFAWLILSKPK